MSGCCSGCGKGLTTDEGVSRNLSRAARACLSAKAAFDKSGIIPKTLNLIRISLAGARRHRVKTVSVF